MTFAAFKNIFPSSNQLDKEFKIFLQRDKNSALSMIKNGYKPNYFQAKKLHSLINKEAFSNPDFLFIYRFNFSLIEDKAFINYLTTQSLETKCTDGKNVYDNFSSQLILLKNREKFSVNLKEALIDKLLDYKKFVMSLKPYYSHIDQFKFDLQQNKKYSEFLKICHNGLTLLPIMIDKNLIDFMEIKDTYNDIYKSILKHVTSFETHNTSYTSQNKELFKIKILHSWVTDLNNYDVNKLQKNLIDRIKLNLEENNIKKTNEINMTYSLQKLLPQFNVENQSLLNNIIDNYNHLKKESHNQIFVSELNNIFKDTLLACEKYLSIRPENRNDTKNTDGKNAQNLLNESLNHINDIFLVYINNIEEYKVSLLSAHNRKIKMR